MEKFNVCIVGGGSTYTLGFLKSFVRLKEEFPIKKLVLFDIDGDRQRPICGTKRIDILSSSIHQHLYKIIGYIVSNPTRHKDKDRHVGMKHFGSTYQFF